MCVLDISNHIVLFSFSVTVLVHLNYATYFNQFTIGKIPLKSGPWDKDKITGLEEAFPNILNSPFLVAYGFVCKRKE